jgi:nucleolar MIF4G domain-containing protein 1
LRELARLAGRWWLVGSAWTGNKVDERSSPSSSSSSNLHTDSTQSTKISGSSILEEAEFGEVSADLHALAKKLRMNTDIRKAIFFVIMTAEACWDFSLSAFEYM